MRERERRREQERESRDWAGSSIRGRLPQVGTLESIGKSHVRLSLRVWGGRRKSRVKGGREREQARRGEATSGAVLAYSAATLCPLQSIAWKCTHLFGPSRPSARHQRLVLRQRKKRFRRPAAAIRRFAPESGRMPRGGDERVPSGRGELVESVERVASEEGECKHAGGSPSRRPARERVPHSKSRMQVGTTSFLLELSSTGASAVRE